MFAIPNIDTISECVIPTCHKPLGHDSKDMGWIVCLEHRNCPICEHELEPADVRRAWKESVEKDASIELAHARCLVGNSKTSLTADPTLSIKQSHYDWLNAIRLMVDPDMALSISTNENNAMIYHSKFVHEMDWDQKYAHQKMLEACVASISLALAQDKKKLKERADEREKEKFVKATKQNLTATRPANKKSDDAVEETLGLFMQNFGITSRTVALRLQKQRDKSVAALMALKIPSQVAKDQADLMLKESIGKGLTKIEE
jgi:hypothetical protein